MTGSEIIQKVRALGLPQNEYVVFGSCPLAIAGLRESADIDLFVSPELFENMRESGWQQPDALNADKLVKDVFEACRSWDFGTYQPTLEDILRTADIAQGIPVASLEEVKRWKHAFARPKDLQDIALIDTYVKSGI